MLHKITGTGRTYAETYAEAESVEERRRVILAGVERVTVAPMLRRTNRLDPERVAIDWRPE